jgi:hypothetical protein
MMLKSVAAFCTRHTSRFNLHPNHLPPFALCLALPSALAGRNAGDYYGGSVALALAGGRRSRGTSSSHVRGRRRCPTHPLAWPHRPMFVPAKVRRPHGSCRRTGRWRSSDASSARCSRSPLGIGVQVVELSPYRPGRTRPALQRLGAVAPFSQHALVPSAFRPQVSW